MLPIRKILCTTDFSDPSYRGVRTADELARHFGASLIAVHVTYPIPLPIPPDAVRPALPLDVEAYKRNLDEHALLELDAALVSVGVEPGEVRRVVRNGNAADEIVAVAVDEGVDLIVISTHGHTGVRRLILGSVAERVVRTAPCPVLTVHISS